MKSVCRTITALICLVSVMQCAAAEKPNIVFIIADDVGVEDLRPYGLASVQTPNLERLAREGMRFDRAFLTCSSCSPSRCSMLTGRYPHQTGGEQLHWPLPGEQVGFTELLRKAGYWTAAVGKWHLGDAARNKFDLVEESPMPVPPNAETATAEQLELAGHSGCTRWVSTIKNRPKDKPFFLWLASHDAHRPYEPNTIPKPHVPGDVRVPVYLPDTPAVRKDLAAYYDEISRLDRYIGDVLAELEVEGVASNTLVAFTSDNGRPFPRCKTTIYDSGIRTPFIVRWPGRIKPQSTSSSLISSVDFAPTFLSVAGIKPTPTFVGVDFSSVFADPKKTVREQIFAEHNWHDYEARDRAVRTDRFKYIRHDYNDLPQTPPADAVRSSTFQEMRHLREEGKLTAAQLIPFEKPPKEELFDLQADPQEVKNVAADKQYGQTLAKLRTVLSRWGHETNDRVPAQRTPDTNDRETGKPLPKAKRPRAMPSDRKYLEIYDTLGFDVN